ncbi:MAG TPA: divalent-cation tolerance protein CutA [Longimicrobiales bacterium]
MEESGARVVLMTAPDRETAERLVRALVEERLVACGNIVPGLTSIYRWQGAIECESEVLVILKTAVEAVPALLARAPALHPYAVPELLVLPVEAGHRPYLEWVREAAGFESDGS